MRGELRRLWPILKVLLGAALLGWIAWKFWGDLQRVEGWGHWLQRPAWLILAGLLYLVGIGFSALYWQRLLKHLGQRPTFPAVVRAYYVGHLGKYVPGKAWALFLRASLIHSGGVRPGLATLTSFYEVLVTMAAGVLVAVVLFAVLAPPTRGSVDIDLVWRIVRLEAKETQVIDRNTSVVLSLLLLAPILIPILPPVFNRLVHRVSLPFREKDTPAPAISWASFLEGLGLTACGWLFLGASLAAVLCAATDLPPGDTLSRFLGRLPAIIGLAYVAGFVILLTPGGLGVREFFLTLFLTPELHTFIPSDKAPGLAVQAVLVLRLVWTAAELAMAAVVYWLRPTPRPTPVTEQ